MTKVTIQLPDNFANIFGETPELRARRLIEDAAIEEYRVGRLSQLQVGELLGLDSWQTESLLSARNVSLNNVQARTAT